MGPQFDAIREQFGPLVWSIASRILNQEADAVDCYQDVFLEAIQCAGRGRIHNWGAYLRWLTTRRAIDSLRKRRTRQSRHTPEDPDLLSDHSSPSQEPELREFVALVRAELAALPAAQAQAFWLVSVEQCSREEVAEQMQIQRNHVGVLVHRAREHLRRRLQHLAPPTLPPKQLNSK